jgi:hypothetical protein
MFDESLECFAHKKFDKLIGQCYITPITSIKLKIGYYGLPKKA